MLELTLLLIAPATGGALLYRLWSTRAPRAQHAGLAVGQIPLALRRRRAMAVRREVVHG
ncbi:hypothetical protein ACFOLC_00190 [Lysobacter cavernae]|uniref:Uncharacterized protein n=1 Tax=Lysobacter cavernae TaxID=1685901 RepID=A0ABV7RKN7_9GAMM